MSALTNNEHIRCDQRIMAIAKPWHPETYGVARRRAQLGAGRSERLTMGLISLSAALCALLGPGSAAIHGSDDSCNTATKSITGTGTDPVAADANSLCKTDWARQCQAFCQEAAQKCKTGKCVRNEVPPECALDAGTTYKGTKDCKCKCRDASCGCDCYYSWNCHAEKRQGEPVSWEQSFCQWNDGAKANGNNNPHDQCKDGTGADGVNNQTVCKCMLPKKTDAPGGDNAARKKSQCSKAYNPVQGEVRGGPCDGLCLTAKQGSDFAYEDSGDVADCFELWARAIIDAAAQGGGLADHDLIHEAESRLDDEDLGNMMGRHVESLLLEMAGSQLSIWHPGDGHGPHGHPVGDLSDNPCLIKGLYRLAAAQAAEIRSRGSAAEILDTIPGICPDMLSHVLPCSDDDLPIDPLTCLRFRVEGFAIFVTTLPVLPDETSTTALSPGCAGACLLPEGYCGILPGPDCGADGGLYMGDDTTCDQFVPSGEYGACCFPGPPYAECISDFQDAACVLSGGTFSGPGSTCDMLYSAGMCLPPPGACCADSGCVDGLFITDCTAIGGGRFLPGVTCGELLQAGFCRRVAAVIEWDAADLSPARTTRSLRFRVTADGSPGQDAIKVTMVDLQHPSPRNLPQNPPPNYTTFDTRMNGVCSGGQYSGHHCDADSDCSGTTNGTCTPLIACTAADEGNGCDRWVGRPGTFYETQGPPLAGPYRAARLQCTPFYWNWVTETISNPITVVGAEIVPSSEYSVQVYGVTCMGAEAGCINVSPAVTMLTRRFGDVDAQYNPPSFTNQPDAIDVAQVVNKFKNALGSPAHYRSQLQPNLPELNASINALDIVAVVDAVKSFAYAFFGPCPCPSTITCGLPCVGCPGMCVKTCVGGENAGEPCINNSHCPNGTCAATGTCRDRCGRCTP